jgi:ELWxxDGT repeat protein
LVKDINLSPGLGSSPRGLTVFNNALYFSASDGVTGTELWRTDGTEGGTVRVKDIAPGVGSIGGILAPLSSSPNGFTVFNNALYFSASDGVTGAELWKSDGTEAGTVRVKDINPTSGAGSAPNALTVLNNALYFSANDGVSGRELWKTDGTDTGTMQVKDLCPGSCSGLPFLVILSVRNEALRSTKH